MVRVIEPLHVLIRGGHFILLYSSWIELNHIMPVWPGLFQIVKTKWFENLLINWFMFDSVQDQTNPKNQMVLRLKKIDF